MPRAGLGADLRSYAPTVDALADAKRIALSFVRAFNESDLAAMQDLLADDFVWHKAITSEGETEPRPFLSDELRGRPSPIPPYRDREEALRMLEQLFAESSTNPFSYRVVSVTAEDDRVAVEMEGEGRNPMNGRAYRNIYFVLMRVRDGKLTLFKEYQDTLHVFDVWAAT
jgi:ketosteroid isomerase-like protein